eukprot:883606-Pelagomonas_calceolata.AAC.1
MHSAAAGGGSQNLAFCIHPFSLPSITYSPKLWVKERASRSSIAPNAFPPNTWELVCLKSLGSEAQKETEV